MTLRFLSLAKIEIDQSFEYYEFQKPSLGEDFLNVVRLALQRIKKSTYSLDFNLKKD